MRISTWIKVYIEDNGVFHIFKDMVRNIVKIIVYTKKIIFSVMEVYVYQLELSDEIPIIHAKVPLRYEIVTDNNVDDILQVESSYKLSQYRHLMKRGEVGFYVYCNSKLAHRCWVVENEGSAPTCGGYNSYPINEKEIFIHLSRTYAEFQRKRIYPAVISYLCTHYMNKGYKRSLIAVETSNIPSVNGVKKMGFHPVARQRVRIIMGHVYRSQMEIE